MGTRHLTIVVQDKQYRVAQYGQWDGYPTGQGETVLDFLLEARKADSGLKRFRKHVVAVSAYTDEELQEIGKLHDWKQRYPHISRDFGASILDYIHNTPEPKLAKQDIGFAADSQFCEWAYVVDLDADRLEVYKGFNKAPLPPSARFHFLEEKADGGYHPIKLVKAWPFSELREGLMSELEAQLYGD